MSEAPYETQKQAGSGNEGIVKYWRDEIDFATRHEEEWRKRARKVVERYRDEKKRSGKKYNLFWANVETLKPAVYSQTPQPDIRRRFIDRDPVGRQAAEILERAVSFTIDDKDFDAPMEGARDDMLLPGRGAVRVKLESDMQVKRPMTITRGGEDFYMMDDEVVEPDGEDDDGPYLEKVGEQYVCAEYVYWEDLRLFPAGVRRWEDVYGIAFRHLLTRKDLVKQFGAKGRDVPLNYTVSDSKDREPMKRAVVWEVWDKTGRQRLWIAENHEVLLDREDDPLGLEGFFPMPKPLYAIETNDTMVPIPEMTIYQDQLDELDEITERIEYLIKACKVRGVYAGVIREFAKLMQGNENELIPVEDWEAIRDKGGIDGAVSWMPIEQIAKVLQILYQQREAIKQEIYEITGLSDLIRGATDARETAAAQRLKGSFGQFRMTPRQKPMERFARDIFRIMAEIIAEHFTQDNLQKMTGMEISDDIMDLLRNDKARGFRIDIETDSTVQPDAEAERAAATEFTGAVTQFLQASSEIVAAEPMLAPLMGEMLKFSVRRFKTGRNLEDIIERTVDQLSQQAQQPKPDPEAEKAKQDMELEKRKGEQSMALKAQEAQLQMQIDKMQAQQEMIINALKSQLDLDIKQAQAEQQQQMAAE